MAPYFVDIHTHKAIDGPAGLRSVRIGTDDAAGYTGKISAGIHPWDAEKAHAEWIDEIRSLNPAAVGEAGLDFAADVDRTAQQRWFIRQIELASELGKPLIVHCVKAYNELIPLIERLPQPVIIHGFTGSEQLAGRLLAAGCHLSFGQSAERSPKTRQALQSVPAERLFLETDTAPVTIESVYGQAAAVRGETVGQLREAIYTNYVKIFGQ